MEFAKRDATNPSSLMRLEYDLLNDKMKLLAKTCEDDRSNFYTDRKEEIEMTWLGESCDQDRMYVWHANMPISLHVCKEVFDAAKKMPKGAVLSLVFPYYDLNSTEDSLFEVIFAYGRAKGLEAIATRLYEGAESGDPRAVKMYLEMMNHIGDDLIDDDERVKRLMRVSIDI